MVLENSEELEQGEARVEKLIRTLPIRCMRQITDIEVIAAGYQFVETNRRSLDLKVTTGTLDAQSNRSLRFILAHEIAPCSRLALPVLPLPHSINGGRSSMRIRVPQG